MSRFASCTWAPVATPSRPPVVRSHRGLVLHRRSSRTAAGRVWHCNADEAMFATFLVPLEGPPRQQIDDGRQAPVLANGAWGYASAEIEGTAEVTPHQIAGLAAIVAEGHRRHGWPLQLAGEPGDAGLMAHGLGGPAFGADTHCPGDPSDTVLRAVLAAAMSLVGSEVSPATGPDAQSEGAAFPVTPVRPVDPVTPVEPVTPVDPVTPVTPVDPVTPVTPVMPIVFRPPLGLVLPTWFTPTAPGSLTTTVTLTAAQLQTSVIDALGSRSVPVGAPAPAEVIWFDHDGEVLVSIGATLVGLLDGLVLISLSLQSDQTGAGQVTVPLGVGTADQPVGMTVATERRPRGPSLLVDRWGEAATAAAWGALVDVAKTMAEQGGADANGAPFVPAAMSATPDGFTVTPQARQAMDSVATS